MHYLLDTVTIIRHFSRSGRIGKVALQILNNCIINNDHFYISIISLMEIMYLAEKNKIQITLADTFDKINKSSIYSIVNLFPEIIKIAEKTDFYELHDRMILATTKWLNVPIISSDKRFDEVDKIKRIWA